MIYKQNHRRTRWFPLRIETIKSMVKKANLILTSRILKNQRTLILTGNLLSRHTWVLYKSIIFTVAKVKCMGNELNLVKFCQLYQMAYKKERDTFAVL